MVQTTATDPGTIAVPMSSILDALEGVLTDEERTALYEQLVGLRPSTVAPGDLITAELFNQVRSDINDLVRRVTLLESASNTTPKLPIIHQIVPQIVHSGDQLMVLGENLNPELLNRIQVNDTPVAIADLLTGSGPTQLIFAAPGIIGLPPAGTVVILTISNAAGSAQATYTQLPGISSNISVNVGFVPKSFTPNQSLAPTTDYAFTYELQIHSSQDETFQLVPHIEGGWTATVKDTDQIPATAASAVNGLTVQKVITVHTPANGGGAGNLVLELKGTKFPGFTQSSQPLPLALGTKPVLPSDQIQFINTDVLGPHAWANNVIKIFSGAPTMQNGATATVNISTMFAATGSYTIDSLTVAPGTDWQISSSPQSPFTVSDINFPTMLSFIIKPLKTSLDGKTFISADGTFSFTVNGPGGATQKFTAALQVRSA
ncbi:hypothetical protein GCM10009087_47480 [Sphingomonas oligophenolica]|uniref:IPT/TIG domain-containing protein n=1 Tax=Sphingomonas oligophenolica TaxID=301154 RepID=A0ABU9Y784_9SPHN